MEQRDPKERVIFVDVVSGLELVEMPDLPVNANPFHHDSYHMGTPVVRGWIIMHQGYDNPTEPQKLPYMIMINTRSGKRIRIKLPKSW